MITVYNPISGEWERINDTNRPFPVIARDTRLLFYQAPQIVITATNASPNNIDPFGTSGTNPPPTFTLPDGWRVRRVIITALRECTDTLTAVLDARLYGRLTDETGTPVNNTWFVGGGTSIAAGNDASASGGVRFTRLVIPSTLSGALGFDQYRITFCMTSQSGTGEFRLSHIKVYVEL